MTAYGPYTPIRQAGNLYFISGQVGITADTKPEADIADQTRQALANLQRVLASKDLLLADVIKTTVFLRDITDFVIVNQVYMEYFVEPRPARSCVEVSRLPILGETELLIEIEAVAFKEARHD